MAIWTLMSTVSYHIYYKLSIYCGANNFTRKKFFMAMLAFEDDSHFERKAEIAILRFSKKRWPLIVGGETAHCVDAIPLMFLGEGCQNHNTPIMFYYD
jgi:hypothetical protein